MFSWFKKKETFTPKIKKVLIVENNELDRTILTDLLEYYFYETRQTGEGSNVIKIATEFQPGLIVMAKDLPDVSGKEVIGTLKDIHALKDIPIIVISALFEPGDEDEFLKMGCESIVSKPINVSQFRKKIDKIFE